MSADPGAAPCGVSPGREEACASLSEKCASGREGGNPALLRRGFADGPHNLHASCVVVGESGILIRGASGAGKSSLAGALVSQARLAGEFAAWVADDRVMVTEQAGRLIAAPHDAIAGRFEARGLGILSEPHEPRAVLRLLVDLEDEVGRLPSGAELTAIVAGVALQRLPLVEGRAGLYETSLVLRLLRVHREIEGRLTSVCRVGAAGYLTET